MKRKKATTTENGRGWDFNNARTVMDLFVTLPQATYKHKINMKQFLFKVYIMQISY